MPLQTAYLLNPPRRRRRKLARRSRRRARRYFPRRRNDWPDNTLGHRKAARLGWSRRRRGVKGYVPAKGWHRKRRKGRKQNPLYRDRRGRFTSRRTVWRVANEPGRRRRRRKNPAGTLSLAGVRMGLPEVLPGVRLPLPGVIGTVANSVVQGVIAGGVVFAGYAASGAIADYLITSQDAAAARSAGNTFKGYWARPLVFTGLAAALGGVAAMVAPRSKKLLWSLLAAAGPAMRAFGGVLFALVGGESGIAKGGMLAKVASVGQGLSDYLQMDGLYEAGMGEEEESEGMEDYLQMEGIYEAGMGAEQEVVGI